ncbi:MAG TPA: chitobiase/beta-hexosaminidase C-terminal domain-containing protein, partial [Polyangiaceae bacterium]
MCGATLAVVLGCAAALTACGGNGQDADPTGAASADESPGRAVELPACDAPTITPIGGSVEAGTPVTIQAPSGFPSAATGARVLYTMDGTKPSASNGAVYDAPIPIASNR